MVYLLSFGSLDWCNIRRMGNLPLGILVYSHCGGDSGSSLCFRHTATNCEDCTPSRA